MHVQSLVYTVWHPRASRRLTGDRTSRARQTCCRFSARTIAINFYRVWTKRRRWSLMFSSKSVPGVRQELPRRPSKLKLTRGVQLRDISFSLDAESESAVRRDSQLAACQDLQSPSSVQKQKCSVKTRMTSRRLSVHFLAENGEANFI